jgi:23S rRNA pseudoU1915 N3-methylase RlmH
MYENIISIYNILKKKTTYLNFQPAQYLKKLTKIILNQKNLKKKEKKKKKKSILGKKKKEKKTCKKQKPCYPTRFRIF